MHVFRRLFDFLGTPAGVGILVTFAVIAADAVGVLGPFERFLSDERIAYFQFFSPKPTDRLVHLDIDDVALESIQRWPWDRATFADVLDEVARAGPAAVAMDVLLTEPQDAKWITGPDGKLERVDQDARLADALAHLGKTVLPASFPLNQQPQTPLYSAVRGLLAADAELDDVQVATRLAATGKIDRATLGDIGGLFLAARRDGMFDHIKAELDRGTTDETEIRRRVLPTIKPGTLGPLTRLFGTQYERAQAATELEKRGQRVVPGATPPVRDVPLALAPIQRLIRRATATGFVDYPPSKDERIRTVPLLIQSGGFVYPQMGLALACETLGVPLEKLTFTADSITIPAPGRTPIVIQTRSLTSRDCRGVKGSIPLAIDLPWFGPGDWSAMYSAPGSPPGAQHVPIVSVWDACSTQTRITQNNQQADYAAKAMYAGLGDSEKVEWFETHPLPPADWKARVTRMGNALDDVKDFMTDLASHETSASQPASQPATSPAASQPAEDEDAKRVRIALSSYRALQGYIEQAPALAAQLDQQRQSLRDKLHDKAIIVGWTATSSLADFVATPLHDKCPGAVVHGVVFNAIMTGSQWRAVAPAMLLEVTLFAGLLTTLIVASQPPSKALLISIAVALGYVVINGTIVFDYARMTLGMAGPLTAIGAVWTGATLTHLVRERRQRALIRRRFRTYVDPQLVDYVENHPTQATFDGERREMTVVFTDLVGFTSLTESLGSKTIQLLNELWAAVVPVVRRSGYLNKFLGDGLMFFYNAPMLNPNHARDAVSAVLEIAQVMERFRAEVTEPRGLPPVDMRIGVSTGDMIVGDAGAGEAGSDYTVLGDNVNLGARFESANKAFGTNNLLTTRTAELTGDEFLFRSIASIRVVGKERPVDACEVLCRRADATPAQLETARLTEVMVSGYRTLNLQACLAAADQLDAHIGPSKLAQLYRDIATEQAGLPPDDPFDGAITLTTK